MRVLAITKIFPNSVEPAANAFNRQQFAALAKLCELEVLATIPWFPFRRRLAAVPKTEIIDGITVHHPRTFYLPKIGLAIAPILYFASLWPDVMKRRGQFDVVLGSWAYPDGVAAIMLAEVMKLPAVVKVHGSDLNVIAKEPAAARNLRKILPRAARVVAVSKPLAAEAQKLGARVVDIVPNGVDNELFQVRDRASERGVVGHGGDAAKWIVYVGRIERPKGVVDLAEAFSGLKRPDLKLIYVGDGGARAACEEILAPVKDRVIFAGAQPHERVARWIGSCDLLVLPSWNEGTPNVILEALASGRRVVATRVGGIPDVVTSDELGELVPARDPAALAGALGRAADRSYDAATVARLGARGGWNESAAALHKALAAAMLSR